ncbi:MAG: YqgE/AlgH family protein [Alphaproteobacteria bacterium]|nr:YqgE/AlgH family protein [Alphaproteobacteria bacterium]
MCKQIKFRNVFAALTLVGALVLTGRPLDAARQAPDYPEFTGSVQGLLLVAKPSMPDPRFAKTVILMVRHDRTGAFGLVINKPLGVAEITDRGPVVRPHGDRGGKPDAEKHSPVRLPAHHGGPVGPDKAFVVHSPDYHIGPTFRVNDEISVTGDRRILRDIAAGRGPKRLLYVAGYAGWGPAQLKDEIRREDWYTAPLDAGLIFGAGDGAAKWRRAMKTRLRGI